MQKLITPSQSTNQVLDLAVAVAEGHSEAEPLRHLLTLRLQGVEAVKEDFHQRLQVHGEAFQVAHGDLIDEVAAGHDAYQAALAELAVAVEEDDGHRLMEGAAALADLTGPMLENLQRYGEVYLSFGTSPYPLLNSARNILQGLLKQQVGPEAWKALVEQAVTYHQQAVSDIKASDYADREGYQAKVKAFEEVMRVLQELEPATSAEGIEAALRPLQFALEAVTLADDKIFAENNSLAPTRMPAANVLINTAKGVTAGQFGVEVFEEALIWYRRFIADIETQFDAAVEGETTSVVILEELPKTREIMDLHEEVMDGLVEAMEEFTAERVEPLLSDLEEVVARLHASSEIYIEASLREGKLVCVACGHLNPPENRACGECNQKLPQLVDPNMYTRSNFEIEESSGLEETSEDGVVTENVLLLFEACYNFFEQKIGEEDYRKVLQWSRRHLEEADSSISSMSEAELNVAPSEPLDEAEKEALEENREMYHDTKALFEEGLDDWSEGLDLMEEFIETRYRPTIEAGIQKVWVGSQKVHRVQKIGEVAERTLSELEERPAEG